MLEFKNVDFAYGEKTLLKDFSFSAKEGVSTAVLGPSGFGKTTLLNLSAGFLSPKEGIITPFSGGKPTYIFQEDRLLPWFTALENLTALGIEKSAAAKYLEKVGLSDAADKYPEELSGGMQRRLAIARALAFGGDIFYFDEPLRGLDIKTSGEILDLIRKEISGKTALIITHSPAEAFFLCDRILLCGNSPLEIISDRKKSDFSDENELVEFIKTMI